MLFKKLDFPFSFEELTQQILEDAIQKADLLNDLKDVSVFWDAISWGTQVDFNPIRENTHYIKDIFQKIIYIKLDKVISFYMDYCRSNNIQYIDKTTLTTLLTVPKQGYIKNNQRGGKQAYNKKKFGRCHRFLFENSNETDTILINGKEINL